MELKKKKCFLLGRKAMTNLDSMLKSRDITLLTKFHLAKAMVCPVAMYGCELEHKESWVLKNWWFWTAVLEKTLENLFYFKEIKPINPKGNQSWIYIGRTDSEVEAPILWPPDVKSWSLEKTLMQGKIEGRRRRGWQRIRWLDGNTDSMDISLSKMWELGKDRKSCSTALHRIEKSQTWISNTITMTAGDYWTCRTKKERKEVASHSLQKPDPFLCKLMCILPHH